MITAFLIRRHVKSHKLKNTRIHFFLKASCGSLGAPASVPMRGGGCRGEGGKWRWGGLKNGAPRKTWVCPHHPWLLYLWVMWVFPSRPQWWLLPRWSLGCKHCHSQEARRHKNLQGCNLFPWPSLSTIQIDIFGVAEKSAKNSTGPCGCVRCGCGIWGPPEPASPRKKLICEWRGGRRAALGAELYACQAARLAHREGGERMEKVWCREEVLHTLEQCWRWKIRGGKTKITAKAGWKWASALTHHNHKAEGAPTEHVSFICMYDLKTPDIWVLYLLL